MKTTINHSIIDQSVQVKTGPSVPNQSVPSLGLTFLSPLVVHYPILSENLGLSKLKFRIETVNDQDTRGKRVNSPRSLVTWTEFLNYTLLMTQTVYHYQSLMTQ